MADVSLVAVPPERDAPTCASCGAELVADQRYCLACGHPVSPVRLAFLDVLGEEPARPAPGAWAPGVLETSPTGQHPGEQRGLGGWLRRNAGLLSLLSVLLLCLIVGLLVGHWVTQNGKTVATGPQVVKIEGLSGLAAASTTPSSTTATPAAPKSTAQSTSAKKEEEEAKEIAAEKKHEHTAAKPQKITPSKVEKLKSTTGRKHAEEINALGNQPIEG